MKKEGVLIALLVSYLSMGMSSCRKHNFPMVERCIIGDDACLCFDPRLPRRQQEYDIPLAECVNYIATNPGDYDRIRVWTEEKIEELEQCRGR